MHGVSVAPCIQLGSLLLTRLERYMSASIILTEERYPIIKSRLDYWHFDIRDTHQTSSIPYSHPPPKMPSILLLSLGFITLLTSVILPTLLQTISTLGVFRTPRSTPILDLVVIRGDHEEDRTLHCEDVHLHVRGGWLFAACEGAEDTRFTWYPPLGCFLDPRDKMKQPGTLVAVDSKVCILTHFL